MPDRHTIAAHRAARNLSMVQSSAPAAEEAPAPAPAAGDSALTFSVALAFLKVGYEAARVGWNGKGMWIKLQVPDEHSKMSLPYIFMKTVDDKYVPWLASQTDLLAEDWQILENGQVIVASGT